MSEVTWTHHRDGTAMAEAVADRIEEVVRDGLARRGLALLGLPGGRSPAPIFERLALRKIDWARVTIVPTDDRLVPPDDPLSNFALLAGHLRNTGARLVPFTTAGLTDYRSAGAAADARLRALPWPPDLIWLGVGTDGHTASIFPGPDLDQALNDRDVRRAVGVLPDPLPIEAPVARVTLTRTAILSAQRLLLAFCGVPKRLIVQQALADGWAATSPIGRVLGRARVPIDIHWSFA